MRKQSRTRWISAGGVAVLASALATGSVALGDRQAGKDAGHHPGSSGSSHSRVAKNVVLMVGDGLSIAARDAIRLATVGKDGRLAMDRLRYAGWTTTDSEDPDEAVTDSAAAATALATGVRTYNGAVSVDVDGRSHTTLLQHAKKLRKSTGLVTTAQVTDATPAAFGAHVPDRADQSEIARQFLDVTKPDVILGGGEDWWYPAGNEGAYPDDPADPRPEVSRSTKGNLVDRARSLGYQYVTTGSQLAAARGHKLLGLFANEEMFEQAPEGQGDAYAPVVPLATMTTKALNVLDDNRHGFFLLVEEEGIDEMEHANNATQTLRAGRAFDRTVAVVHAYAKRHPGTLVVVVGDHETGGLAIENVDADDESGDAGSASDDVLQSLEDGPFPIAGSDLEFTIDWTTGSHTGASTPLTAEGPGSERLARAQKNTHVFDVLLAAMRGGR